jgi:hypothetical protein
MDSSEQRIIGSLLLLLGFTLLTIGLYTGQLAVVLEIVKKAFTTSIIGLP